MGETKRGRALRPIMVLLVLGVLGASGWQLFRQLNGRGSSAARDVSSEGRSASEKATAKAAPLHIRRWRVVISSTLYHPDLGKAIPTPPVIVGKIKKSLALWESVAAAGLRFSEPELGAPSYDSVDAVSDNALTVVLNGNYPFAQRLMAGAGGLRGKAPDAIRKAYLFLNTKTNFDAALSFSTITHELGHALGVVGHNPAPASVMSCGSPPYRGDFLFFAAQDRANLLTVYAPSEVALVEGRLTEPGFRYVFAVNVKTGVSWAALSKSDGRFSIPVGAPGRYRVFAKAYESSRGKKAAEIIPSWHVKKGVATNAPYAGKVFEVKKGSRIEGLELAVLHRKAPFNIFHTMTYASGDIADDMHSFLLPGKGLRLGLFPAGGEVAWIKAYGSAPDYRLTYQSTNSKTGAHFLRVEARSGAVPGHRLLLAKSTSGVIQAGLVGIHVMGGRYPGRLQGKARAQIARNASVAPLDPRFWR